RRCSSRRDVANETAGYVASQRPRGNTVATVTPQDHSKASAAPDESPANTGRARVLHPRPQVEGLVDRMVRGSSSLLGRIGKSPASRSVYLFSKLQMLLSSVWVRLSCDKYPQGAWPDKAS